ncbi:DUF1792 domain-containing protein [Brevibacterium sediminis]|uniref:GT-D fold domain-containing glycosyltransferase n=1 Tax=Brevibacterium sediminis TaxID=1857024 RepID=UPI0021752F81|nr:GT-D fold domain-containing glycosyltransferase [Brevibacterium sediminis]MCS4594593.1 DUF1792 domain-containing protein [Brevibacterium sediminis]
MNDSVEEHKPEQYATTSDLLEVLKQQTEVLKIQERLLRRHERSQKELLERVAQLQQDLRKVSELPDSRADILDYFASAALAPTLDSVWNFLSDSQLSLKSTLERLADSNDSFSRLGDGEFKLMLSPWRNLAFQTNSFELIDALECTAATREPNLLIGLPQFMRNTNYLKLWPKIWGRLQTLVHPDQTYGNSHVSRPLAFQFLGESAVQLWREVWRNKSVSVITGKGSRFDIVPALFDSASKIERIDSTPTDAFSDIERIIKIAKTRDSDIFLISLGPAGTVLSRLLAENGRRALDIGHLSGAYLNIFEGFTVPEKTPLSRQ